MTKPTSLMWSSVIAETIRELRDGPLDRDSVAAAFAAALMAKTNGNFDHEGFLRDCGAGKGHNWTTPRGRTICSRCGKEWKNEPADYQNCRV